MNNNIQIKKELVINHRKYSYYDISTLQHLGINDVSRLPYSYKILLECALRNYDEELVTLEHIKRIATWSGVAKNEDLAFLPARIVLQDFTGVPVVVDLATMRDKMEEMGQDASKINPLIPVDLVIDHSVMVDYSGSNTSLNCNVALEFERNTKRYELLKWAQNSFENFRVFPPSIGIIHQVNLEYLASVARVKEEGKETVIYPDTLVGTDSHTTMINGIGVLGWGVGGIEAEACMLGQPYYFIMPEVIGFELTGKLTLGVTATDLVLTITNILRKEKVVGKFVEFFGDGLKYISVEDRSTIANMCPEYGATCAYFPVDDKTLDFLRATGRKEEQIQLVEAYYKAQGMFQSQHSPKPIFTKELSLDLSTVKACIAGPKRPQDQILLTQLKKEFPEFIKAQQAKSNSLETAKNSHNSAEIKYPDGSTEHLIAGSIVIAAITSCTNTSNPYVIMGAGLLAKKAVECGLRTPQHVKTSFGPGSLVVTQYLEDAGLLPYMEQLGFHVVGYGCTTCIGNSGPLDAKVEDAIKTHDLPVAAVLSGNRNFEGRIHALVKLNFLMSPMLVVAFALAGNVNIDMEEEAIGYNKEGKPIYLKDVWPSSSEIESMVRSFVKADIYLEKYKDITHSNRFWNQLPESNKGIYQWDEYSTYIKKPPFFDHLQKEITELADIHGAYALAIFGDSVTTDHISPAGSIPETSDAGNYLTAQNVKAQEFNSYGSRRGTHEVMMRGTFANLRIRNRMIPEVEGGYTKHIPSNSIMTIYNACMKYKETKTPLIVIAGKEYGTGSSRDWAAKGTSLLGVKVVLAQSFERIHKSNLCGMGVLPLQFKEGIDVSTLGITGDEIFDFLGLEDDLYPNKEIKVIATKPDGRVIEFEAIARLDSKIEVEYYKHGGILNMMMRKFLSE